MVDYDQLWDNIRNLETPEIEKTNILIKGIWQRRNEFIFQNKLKDMIKLVYLSLLEHEDFQAAQERATDDIQIVRVKRLKRWHPPLAHAIKVNCDVAICPKN